ncbi:flagellar export chaperone FlgN [Candidatus Latescibacterota bacterium]
MVLKKNISEITDILKREIRSFNTILELLTLEEKSLVECDTNALADILERQEDVLSSIACLERSRMDVLKKIAEQTGQDPDTLTVSVLAESVEGAIKKEFIESGHILAHLNEDIQRKRATNTMLINQAIMLVDSDIRVILNAANRLENREAVYTQEAESGRTSESVCIDERM